MLEVGHDADLKFELQESWKIATKFMEEEKVQKLSAQRPCYHQSFLGFARKDGQRFGCQQPARSPPPHEPPETLAVKIHEGCGRHENLKGVTVETLAQRCF